MNEILAVIDRKDRLEPVLEVASAYSALLDCRLVVYAEEDLLRNVAAASSALAQVMPAVHRLGRDRPATVVRAAARPGVRFVVVPATDLEHGGWCADLLQECPAPVLVVPDAMAGFGVSGPTRVLAPLDGSPESTAAVAEVMGLFAAAGADVVVLHVFGQQTAPPFWDQPVHARRSWGEEFLARHAPVPGIRLELRTGAPGEEVLAVAAAEDADLIALGWSCDLSPGRAQTVRQAVGGATVPVLLVPLTEAHAVAHHHSGMRSS